MQLMLLWLKVSRDGNKLVNVIITISFWPTQLVVLIMKQTLQQNNGVLAKKKSAQHCSLLRAVTSSRVRWHNFSSICFSTSYRFDHFLRAPETQLSAAILVFFNVCDNIGSKKVFVTTERFEMRIGGGGPPEDSVANDWRKKIGENHRNWLNPRCWKAT